jgi:hypothetical protein
VLLCVVGMTAHLARRPMRCPCWPSPGASRKPPNRPSQPDCVRAEKAECGHGKAATSRPGPRTLRPARVRVKPRVACGQTDGARHPRLPSANQGPAPTRAQCQPGPSANAELALRQYLFRTVPVPVPIVPCGKRAPVLGGELPGSCPGTLGAPRSRVMLTLSLWLRADKERVSTINGRSATDAALPNPVLGSGPRPQFTVRSRTPASRLWTTA